MLSAMKYFLTSLLFTLCSGLAFCQVNQTIRLGEAHLNKEYRLRGYVHTLDSGIIEFWAYQRDLNGKYIRDRSLKLHTAPPDERGWRKVSLEGKI